MPRYLTVAAHLPIAELAARARHAQDPVARRHWQLVWLVAQGRRVPAVAPVVGYTANWARAIVRRYNAAGPSGLGDRRHLNAGQPPLLTPALRTALREALDGPAPDGGPWTSPKVAAWMAVRLGRPVAPARGWETLWALGFQPHRLR
jgi:transposase